jgi:hypothetical protein
LILKVWNRDWFGRSRTLTNYIMKKCRLTFWSWHIFHSEEHWTYVWSLWEFWDSAVNNLSSTSNRKPFHRACSVPDTVNPGIHLNLATTLWWMSDCYFLLQIQRPRHTHIKWHSENRLQSEAEVDSEHRRCQLQSAGLSCCLLLSCLLAGWPPSSVNIFKKCIVSLPTPFPKTALATKPIVLLGTTCFNFFGLSHQ